MDPIYEYNKNKPINRSVVCRYCQWLLTSEVKTNFFKYLHIKFSDLCPMGRLTRPGPAQLLISLIVTIIIFIISFILIVYYNYVKWILLLPIVNITI